MNLRWLLKLKIERWPEVHCVIKMYVRFDLVFKPKIKLKLQSDLILD